MFHIWKYIDLENISHLTNALDGSKDDALWVDEEGGI